MPGGIVLTAKHFASYFVLPKKYVSHIHYHTIIRNTFVFHVLQIILKNPIHLKEIVFTEMLARISLNV